MSLKAKIEDLNKSATAIRELTRSLNIEASRLNGVAAVVPDNAPVPISYFKGCKTILHNVSYDHGAGCICAAITLPHADDIDKDLSGSIHRINVDENWFE